MKVQIKNTGNKIAIFFPMTKPHSRARIKRRIPERESEPVFKNQHTIGCEDYIEWQIAYDSEFKPLIVESRHLNLLSQQDFEELDQLLNTQFINSIEESYEIRLKEKLDESIVTPHGFDSFALEVPFYEKLAQKYAVQITIKNQQRGAGKQAMIYLCLPIIHCTSCDYDKSFVGRKAETNERAVYYINAQNVPLIYDLVFAFAIASQKHRNDLKKIFDKVATIL